MFELSQLLRKNIRDLLPYSSARGEFSGTDCIYLDANENPFGLLNRYPDPFQSLLKEKIGLWKQISIENIFLGNGSDEVIDLLIRILCKPAKDKVMICSPSYGMYSVAANINDVEVISIPLLGKGFQPDINSIKNLLDDTSTKLIFICSPNNPTGNCIGRESINYMIDNFHGIVCIDEAYIDFCSEDSWITHLDENPNLLVMQTLSKAWGLAGARIGMAFAGCELVNLLNKVKPPYNISGLNQNAAIQAIDNHAANQTNIKTILTERYRLEKLLPSLECVVQVYPSQANFLLVRMKDAHNTFHQLKDAGIMVRNRTELVENCLRITIGKKEENDKLIEILEK